MTIQEQRISKLRTIVASIRKAEKDFAVVVEEKLISEIQLRFGAARRTALDYLGVLEEGGEIVREGGNVWTAAGYKGKLQAKESWKYFKEQEKKNGI